jgi:hypothetical protein
MSRVVLFFACVVTITGCAGYRVVHRTPAGGTIALAGDREEALKQARSEMTAHCTGPFTIIEEGEVLGPRPSSALEDAAEWRVTYVCGADPLAPATVAGAPSAGGI